jgi:hypothetical protein
VVLVQEMLDALLFAVVATLAYCCRTHIMDWLFVLLGWGSDFHFSRIRDKFKTFAQVEEALRASGLESCELIVGVDFTKVCPSSTYKYFQLIDSRLDPLARIS